MMDGMISYITDMCKKYDCFSCRVPAVHLTTMCSGMTIVLLLMNSSCSPTSCATLTCAVPAQSPSLPQLTMPTWWPSVLATIWWTKNMTGEGQKSKHSLSLSLAQSPSFDPRVDQKLKCFPCTFPTAIQTIFTQFRIVSLPSTVPRAAMCLVRVMAGTPRHWPKQFRFTMTLWGPCILPELHLVVGTSLTYTDPIVHTLLSKESLPPPPIHLLNPDLTLCRGKQGGARQPTLDWERKCCFKNKWDRNTALLCNTKPAN